MLYFADDLNSFAFPIYRASQIRLAALDSQQLQVGAEGTILAMSTVAPEEQSDKVPTASLMCSLRDQGS